MQSFKTQWLLRLAFILLFAWSNDLYASRNEIVWTAEYTADSLPQESTPAWAPLYDPFNCKDGFNHLETTSNGLLRIWRQNGYVYFISGEVLNAPATVEFKMRANYNSIPIEQRCAVAYFGAGNITVWIYIS